MVDAVPIQVKIRKTVFENFNNVDGKFTNDEIFELLKKNNQLDPSLTIDDVEKYFLELCDTGMARNIAQNFTTIWLKLFDPLEKHRCQNCDMEVYVAKSEEKLCPNPECKASL